MRDHVPVCPPARAPRRSTSPRAPRRADRDAFLAAVADARPAARRLFDLVDGLVDVRIGPTGEARAIGLTESDGDRYIVTVDFATVAQRYGRRGIDRVVLHEIGHVVDFAIVPRGRDRHAARRRDPGRVRCDEGVSGACADEPERFAESFAKWATGDIGADLYIGYKVLPPSPTLEAWGAPLAALGR